MMDNTFTTAGRGIIPAPKLPTPWGEAEEPTNMKPIRNDDEDLGTLLVRQVAAAAVRLLLSSGSHRPLQTPRGAGSAGTGFRAVARD